MHEVDMVLPSLLRGRVISNKGSKGGRHMVPQLCLLFIGFTYRQGRFHIPSEHALGRFSIRLFLWQPSRAVERSDHAPISCYNGCCLGHFRVKLGTPRLFVISYSTVWLSGCVMTSGNGWLSSYSVWPEESHYEP